MTTCPTCGQTIRGQDADRLLGLLQSNQQRNVYRAQGGGWFVNHGGGEVSAEAVKELVRRGAIVKVYSTCEDAFHVGKTIDMPATLEYRKGKLRKDWQTLYTDGSQSAALMSR